jgi:putative two-component system response regulator
MLSNMPGELGCLARAACEFHHEWHNGGGYWGIPTGKLPDHIPIIAICDVFVACCAKRPYKDPWPPEQVLEHLQTLNGTQFSANIVSNFTRLIKHSQSVPAIFTLSEVVIRQP